MLCEMGQGSLQDTELRGENMLVPDEVTAMVRLRGLGWGTKRIAREMGCSRTTVKRYLEAGGWIAYRKPRRGRRLDGLERWLSERFDRHRGNADVVRQDLARERGLVVSLRTIERAVAPLRQALRAEARATIRFETPPGKRARSARGKRR
jgi:transposase